MAGVPSSPINNLDTALEDPQLAARHVVMTYEHPVGGTMKTMAHPVLFEGTSRGVRLPPPMHGEHSREILKDRLDITDEAIDELIRTGCLKADSMRK
ncbi:acyl-CoA transferase [Advenella kashmirensis WT001]|uniref:Acyl-CoA transferase n=1 Tax=Advenella kashmirensis (strain DSM 17095 / LMG 22695 / WT001) TaxID=1036672 RepID=I3UAZ9_ADVKW|nr:acyl-CoA transferase [Advenella kashmirensis WT001]